MKFVLDRKPALDALNATFQAVARNATIPILEHVLIDAREESLSFAATDLAIRVTTTVAAKQIESAGKIAVPGQRFRDVLSSLPDGADFTFEIAESRAIIRCGRSRFSMPTLPGADFPDFTREDYPVANGFTMEAKRLARLLEVGSYCMADDKVRTYFYSAFLHLADDGALRVVSTDGFWLVMADSDPPAGFAPEHGAMIPARAIPVALKLLSNVAPEASVSLDVGDRTCTLATDSSTLVARLLDWGQGGYPRYQALLKTSFSAIIEVDTDLLIGAVSRAMVMAGDHNHLRLSVEPGRMRFNAAAIDVGEAADELECDYDGEPFASVYNGTMIRSLLDLVATENTVLKFSPYDAKRSSLTVLATGTPDWYSLVAPTGGG